MSKINYITIQQYLDGTLDKEAMHELEKEALNDPFLADALEGYSYSSKPVAPQLSLLQMQLEKRIAQQQENKNVLNFSWQRLSIAAAAGLLFVTATVLLWMKTNNAEQQLARQPKTVDVTLTPMDSVDAGKNTSADNREDQITEVETAKTTDKQLRLGRNTPKKKQTLNQTANVLSDVVTTEARAQTLTKPELKDVVVIGYGTQKKREVTGSIARVSELATENNAMLLKGKVVSKTGEPLPGASIRIRGTVLGTTTNAQGEFALKDSVGGVLDVQYLGFLPQQVAAKPGDPITIALKEAPSSLNEVAIIGYGQTLKLEESSIPAIGWKGYNDYLKQNLRMPAAAVSGTVVVSFAINASNEPTDLVIKKGLSDEANNEAIRLIKEGPAWVRGQDTTVRVTVRFKK